MKFYEAPEFTKVEFFVEDVLADSIISPGDMSGKPPVEVGPLPVQIFGKK